MKRREWYFPTCQEEAYVKFSSGKNDLCTPLSYFAQVKESVDVYTEKN